MIRRCQRQIGDTPTVEQITGLRWQQLLGDPEQLLGGFQRSNAQRIFGGLDEDGIRRALNA